ncbi:MAG TPA: ABC transporter ATP-binding protein [Candidatus Hydrogenedentes bacterium]|nr:ABC transporter ATP-binding protein [Candidatus Hydrogenedentota bacterium]HQH51983.1 ABC transporter ATP-binding protein [Candidatus Hydrogenedentota bacterium]HQM50131.1 ABC transporter ATP-binding protein [Candidatus Hydrogenedentota bacterium]
MPLLDVNGLTTCFHTREGVVRAVDGVSFRVEPGETIGIVGESGSGKSVANLSLLGLIPAPPGRIEKGAAAFDGVDLLTCGAKTLRGIRGQAISMIFQDPMTALNPFMRVGDQIVEPLRVHQGVSRHDARTRAAAMLKLVGIQDEERSLSAWPHEFSGGMRQRVMIAMALITRPKLLIADEPTTALDVTIQAQILELLARLQQEMGMAVILITHDLGVVARVCRRIYVMYAGKIMESAATEDLFARPRHPYTEALLQSLPSTHIKGEPLHTIPGLPPDLMAPVEGCPFAARCAKATERCKQGIIALQAIGAGRHTACFRVQEGEL